MRFPFRLPALRHVERYLAHEDGCAGAVELGAAARGNPAYLATGQHHAIVHFVAAVALERSRQCALDRFAVVGMQTTQNAIQVQPLRLREPEQGAPTVGRPDVIPREVPNPDTEVRGLGGQEQPLLAFA